MTEDKPHGEIKLTPEMGQRLAKMLQEQGETGLQLLLDAQVENQKLRDEKSKLEEDAKRSGGVGTLPSSLNQGEGNYNAGTREWEGNTMSEAMRNMVADLRASNDPEDKLTLKKMFAQSVQALHDNPSSMSWTVKDDFRGDKSAIMHKIDQENERLRKGIKK